MWRLSLKVLAYINVSWIPIWKFAKNLTKSKDFSISVPMYWPHISNNDCVKKYIFLRKIAWVTWEYIHLLWWCLTIYRHEQIGTVRPKEVSGEVMFSSSKSQWLSLSGRWLNRNSPERHLPSNTALDWKASCLRTRALVYRMCLESLSSDEEKGSHQSS